MDRRLSKSDGTKGRRCAAAERGERGALVVVLRPITTTEWLPQKRATEEEKDRRERDRATGAHLEMRGDTLREY